MKLALIASVIVALCFSLVLATTPRSQAKLTSLPGLEPFPTNFDQYAGYITINQTQNTNMFYWFVTSQNNPATDPVVLWLQGGPGCSGVGDGFLWEHGPFLTQVNSYSPRNVTLTTNPYAWNKAANVIYVESPIGVGFSYSGSKNYATNDNATAILNYQFLQNFFQMYTEFRSNEFWISGESYGGVYVPTLAYQILTGGSDPTLAANLKRGGLTLGNPVTRCDGNVNNFGGKDGVLFWNTQVNLYYWHGMASPKAFQEWINAKCDTANPPNINTCLSLYNQIESSAGILQQPPVPSQGSMLRNDIPEKRVLERDGAINPDCLYYSYCTGNGTMDFNTAINPTCFSIPDQINYYLNLAEVQKAINAVPTDWNECNGLFYSRNAGSLMPYLRQIFQLAPSTRILYYSGDTDIATVPFAQTERCLDTLQSPIVKSWRPWLVNREVAGYIEEYKDFTYATIKGAGHEAPGFQPAAAYLLYTSFLQNKRVPTSF